MRKLHRTLAGFTVAGLVYFAGAGQAFAFKVISFNGKAARWGKTQVNYVVDARGSKNFKDGCDGKGTCVSERQAIRKAFDSWTGAPGVNISFTEDATKTLDKTGYDKVNSIKWVEKGWTALSFSPPSGALAVTISTYSTSNSAILDSDIHFNGEYFAWAVIDTPEEENSNVIDIQNIATHEIGHFIGLDHSSENIYEPNMKLYLATMFFASGPGETFRRDLEEDDLNAVKNLYPSNDYEAPTVEQVSPNAFDASVQGTALVHISGKDFLPFASVVIPTNSNLGDVRGNITSIDENGIDVAFDISGLSSGDYDIVVSNTYDSLDRVSGALSIQGGYGTIGAGESSGGLNSTAAGGGCSVNGNSSASSGLLMLLLPLLLIFPGRLQLARERSR